MLYSLNNETYVTDNLITTVSSSSASDTEIVRIEGHTLANDNFTFSTQDVTLNGQTQVTLSTPLARVTRLANIGSNNLVGSVYVYQTGSSSGGVPSTAAEVHLQTRAGQNQSEKCATTLSSTDYWIVSGIYTDVIEKTAAYVDVELQGREYGGVFRPRLNISATTAGGRARQPFTPYQIFKKNSDVRLSAVADGANTDVSGGIEGVLAVVTG